MKIQWKCLHSYSFHASHALLSKDLPLYDDSTGDSWAPVEIPGDPWLVIGVRIDACIFTTRMVSHQLSLFCFTPIAATCNSIVFEHLPKQHWGRLQSLPWWCHLVGEVFGELRIAFTSTAHVCASCLHAKDVPGSSQLAKEPVVGQGKERATWFHNLSAISMFYQSAAELFITLSLGVNCIRDTQFLSGKSAIVVIRTMMSSSYLSRDAAGRLRFLKTADLVSKEPWELTGAADCLRQWVDLWHQLAKHLVDSQPWTTIRSIVHIRILPIRSSNKLFTICAIQTMLRVIVSGFHSSYNSCNKALNCHYVFIFFD